MRRRDLLRALEVVGLSALPASVLAVAVVEAQRTGVLAIDFRNVSGPIRGLPHGSDPYVLANVGEGGHFLWTILAGWLLLPLTLIPGGYVLLVALEAAGVAAAALLLGVRDWRLIAVALAWPATVNSVQTGNITVLVLVLLAATWHDRDHARAGLWAGLAVAVKLFAWPVLVWLVATRRWRAVAAAGAVQAVALMMMLPYTSVSEFERFERQVDRAMAGQAITIAALARYLGTTPAIALTLTLILGLTILWFGRRDLGWVVVAMLVLSPVVWLHYYGLLMIPLALWTTSLAVWFLPLLLLVAPGHGNGGTAWRTAASLSVATLVVMAAWEARRTRRPFEREVVRSPRTVLQIGSTMISARHHR